MEMKMVEQQQRHKHPSNRRSISTKKKKSKDKNPFFPTSPTSVGSPKDDGARFYPRSVRQRTPEKLCSLALPPPLISLFDNGGGGVGVDAPASSAARLAASSDIASLDGHSTLDNTNSAAAAPPPHGAYTPGGRHSSNASAVSASVVSTAASAGGMAGSASGASSGNNNPHRLPSHLRAGMAPCDPLLVFRGRFALVGTCDGRIAIYSILDFDDRGGISEDVEASERRRRVEWKEEDELILLRQRQLKGGYEKKDELTQRNNRNNQSETSNELLSDTEEEENESDMRDRMHRREKARQSVDPILIMSLPQSNHGSGDDKHPVNSGSYDEESTSTAPRSIANPPTIVAMCATPDSGTSLIERRGVADSEDQTDTAPSSSQPPVPTFGKDLLGHVAVLVGDGQVHVLEFLILPMPTNELRENDAECSGVNEKNTIPIVNFVLSFRTGHLGATCICLHPVPDTSSKFEDGQQRTFSTTESVHNDHQIRLCVGHQSGLLTSFRIYSMCTYPGLKKVTLFEGKGAQTEQSAQIAARHHSHETQTSCDPTTISHPRSKSNDMLQNIGPNNMTISPRNAAPDPRVSFQKNTDCSNAANMNDLGNIRLHRTLSEPISASQVESVPVVGPTKVALCWRGRFDDPIRSVSSPGWGSPRRDKGALLVVGTERRLRENANQDTMSGMFPSTPHHSLSPAISLEVINATLAEKYWCQIKNSEVGQSEVLSEFSPNGGNCVSMYDCSIWPAAGKEIKDGWIRGSLRRGVDPKDGLYSMLGLQRTSVTNQICCFEGPDSCFAAASSDGTVTISHYIPGKSWGIMEEDNQIMLSQRCIGMGTFDYGGNKSDFDGDVPGARRYVVCCLRGGTIYLVPVLENGASNPTLGQSDVTVFAVPVDPDGDDDGLVRFVQNFTAGVAQVVHWKDRIGTDKSHLTGNATDNAMKSVALVGWPGGNIDVYEVAPGWRRNTDILTGEIFDKGVVAKLVQRLLEIDKRHPLISSDLWRRAWNECHEGSNVDAILKGIKHSPRRDFAAMKSLLLSLAQ